MLWFFTLLPASRPVCPLASDITAMITTKTIIPGPKLPIISTIFHASPVMRTIAVIIIRPIVPTLKYYAKLPCSRYHDACHTEEIRQREHKKGIAQIFPTIKKVYFMERRQPKIPGVLNDKNRIGAP